MWASPPTSSIGGFQPTFPARTRQPSPSAAGEDEGPRPAPFYTNKCHSGTKQSARAVRQTLWPSLNVPLTHRKQIRGATGVCEKAGVPRESQGRRAAIGASRDPVDLTRNPDLPTIPAIGSVEVANGFRREPSVAWLSVPPGSLSLAFVGSMKREDTSSEGAAATGDSHPMPEIPPTGMNQLDRLVAGDVRSLLASLLNGPLLERFQQLTGHRLHVLWHEPHEFHNPATTPVLCPVARASLDSGLPLSSEHAICQRDHWCPLAPTTGHGRQLHGACGAHGFWAGVQVGPLRPVTLVLHATAASTCFNQAVKLLLQILRKVETTMAAEQACHELDQALRQAPIPDATSDLAVSHPVHAHGPHATAVVRTMLDHVHAHYHRPLTLSDLAATLGMNASYLSSLFAAAMGVRFHHYLNEFRLGKAMELLRDPLRRICEVATATGHASPNHFNNLFKSMTGVSPSAWRDANLPSCQPAPVANATPKRKSKKS